ncbi:MAG: hypothetical protein MK193_11390 [Lentisphaeria bacterium]|nr:hypothetical protein [Lentisphaeria bacterium]
MSSDKIAPSKVILIFLGIFTLLLIIILLLNFLMLENQIEKYSSSVPKVVMTTAKIDDVINLNNQLSSMKKQVDMLDDTEQTVNLSLDEVSLNTAYQSLDYFKTMRENMPAVIQLTDEQILIEFSIPIQNDEETRYINSTLELQLEYTVDGYQLQLVDGFILNEKGEEIPLPDFLPLSDIINPPELQKLLKPVLKIEQKNHILSLELNGEELR